MAGGSVDAGDVGGWVAEGSAGADALGMKVPSPPSPPPPQAVRQKEKKAAASARSGRVRVLIMGLFQIRIAGVDLLRARSAQAQEPKWGERAQIACPFATICQI